MHKSPSQMQAGRRAVRHRCPEGSSLSRCFCDVSQHGPYPPRTSLIQLPKAQAAVPTWGSHLQEKPCRLLGCRAMAYTGNCWVSDRPEIGVLKACATSGLCHKLSRGRKYFHILLICYLESCSVKWCPRPTLPLLLFPQAAYFIFLFF